MADTVPYPESASIAAAATIGAEASPEVKSKYPGRNAGRNAGATKSVPPPADSGLKNYDREPVFLIMVSGQIESAEVSDTASSLREDHIWFPIYRYQNLTSCIVTILLCMDKTGPQCR